MHHLYNTVLRSTLSGAHEKMTSLRMFLKLIIVAIVVSMPALAEGDVPTQMNNARLDQLIRHLDENTNGQLGNWSFTIENVGLQVITDEDANRMRIIAPIIKASVLDKKQLYRLMQANFDTALDVRYAIANGILWSTFIHPLGSLSDDDFLTALGQTVNAAITFGSSYSSGVLNYRDGDSQGLLRKELIEQLKKKGKAI